MMTLAKHKFQMADEILLPIMVEAFPIIIYTKQLDDGSRTIIEIIEGEDLAREKPSLARCSASVIYVIRCWRQ